MNPLVMQLAASGGKAALRAGQKNAKWIALFIGAVGLYFGVRAISSSGADKKYQKRLEEPSVKAAMQLLKAINPQKSWLKLFTMLSPAARLVTMAIPRGTGSSKLIQIATTIKDWNVARDAYRAFSRGRDLAKDLQSNMDGTDFARILNLIQGQANDREKFAKGSADRKRQAERARQLVENLMKDVPEKKIVDLNHVPFKVKLNRSSDLYNKEGKKFDTAPGGKIIGTLTTKYARIKSTVLAEFKTDQSNSGFHSKT